MTSHQGYDLLDDEYRDRFIHVDRCADIFMNQCDRKHHKDHDKDGSKSRKEEDQILHDDKDTLSPHLWSME